MKNLPTLVREKFKAAQAAGDLNFYATQVAIVQVNSFPFQLRYSPALAHKPKSSKPRDPNQKPSNPFLNPSQLLVCELAPAHNIVLNKFPVIPHHFILATKEFKKQTDLLEESDLEAAYKCLKAYKDEGEELFGFFNSGEHSGASQPHRHIQFLPVESMRSGLTQGTWRPLADYLVDKTVSDLPFVYFSAALSPTISSSELHSTYLRLHQDACRIMELDTSDKELASAGGDESRISYNLGLTDKSIVLCPRTSEGLSITGANGDLLGPIALNGTLLAGTLLVKSPAEWEAVQKNETILIDVLEAIGVPPKPPKDDPITDSHNIKGVKI
ncbi:5 5 -P-1P-4-tetraphosphate phosphorylase 2 protein [Rutstroemia sp. NJR-2017a BBW]|nr:5 5 -P-1P-4-tetraphosphate phosphorylase 2 protein [Rutstroemia sp. NJR-2017a BBW]